jgi:hypothetical protein
VNDYLLRKVQEAYNPGQEAAIDESMIATCTRWCPFKQMMKCKPIKNGIKVFCLVLCKPVYLWNWDVFLGKDPTREIPYVFDLIYNKLVPSTWDSTGKILYMDNFFTSIPLFRALRGREIFAVGPSCATRPAKLENCTEDSIPFQKYNKSDARLVGGKGWMRHALQEVPEGASHASTWLDNRFLVILSTVFIIATAASSTVLRWTKSERARMAVRAPLALICYALMMGAVDRLDKSNALACIRIRRCQRRYHRQIFFWFVSSIGHQNTKVIWEDLLGEQVVKSLRKKHKNFGYFHWVQFTLGEGLIMEGLQQAKQECWDSAGPDAESTPSPHFMPGRRKRVCRPSPTLSPIPISHELVPVSEINLYDSNRNKIGTLKRARCPVCAAGAIQVKRAQYKMPDGSALQRPYTGCSKCKVCLCKACFEKYDHEKNQVRPETVLVK